MQGVVWSHEAILAAIKAFVQRQGHIPDHQDFLQRRDGLPSVSTVRERFGSWQQALARAGFVPPPRRWVKPAPHQSPTIRGRKLA